MEKSRMYRGWYKVAFERELTSDITATRIGDLHLILVRTEAGLKTFNAACPHRGAHLAHGGELSGEDIVCPFHGYRIGLGESSRRNYKVKSYPTLNVGGLIFVLLDPRHDHGFSELAESLDKTYYLVQGFNFDVRTAPEMVIENGFDRSHFKSVHGLENRPDARLVESTNGELCIEATFHTASANFWQRDTDGAATTTTPVLLRVFSPNLCVTRLGSGEESYLVISGATPNGDGTCTVRVSLACPPRSDGAPPDPRAVRSLLRDSKLAYDQDTAVWEHIVPNASHKLAPEDDLVLEFHRFCETFLEEAAS